MAQSFSRANEHAGTVRIGLAATFHPGFAQRLVGHPDGRSAKEVTMADEKQTFSGEFEELAFQQISTATKGEDVEVYGLTAGGKVFFLDKDKACWIPILMRTARARA